MKKIILHGLTVLLSVGLFVRLEAQLAPADALQLRVDMTTAVIDGTETADVAIIRLAKAKAASGLNIQSGADFALAATDIAHRLFVKERTADALKFFNAAETALTVLVQLTPDTKAAQKADYLQRIAFIRGNYLGQTGQAKLDIDQAISLQPDDKRIQRIKESIGNAHGSVFNEKPVAPKKDK